MNGFIKTLFNEKDLTNLDDKIINFFKRVIIIFIIFVVLRGKNVSVYYNKLISANSIKINQVTTMRGFFFFSYYYSVNNGLILLLIY